MKKSKVKINKVVNSAAVIVREHNEEITKKIARKKGRENNVIC